MTLESNWANTSDVVRASYNERPTDIKTGASPKTSGSTRELVVEFSYDDLPGTSATGGMEITIPANSIITDAYFDTLTAFAGGTSYDIGLNETDGSTAIDADGLWDLLPLAEINAANERSVSKTHAGTNSGALLDTTLSAEAQVVVAATGTFTAGKGRIVIEYIPPFA